MNERRPAGRPARSLAPTRSSQTTQTASRPFPPQRRRRRKRNRNRNFGIFLVVHQIILILLSGGIGYALAAKANKVETPPVETTPPAVSAPAESEPSGDTTPPQIMGVNELSLFLGGTVAYRSGVLVTDDLDPAPQLHVDSFQVNLSAPGTYPLTYTATDSAGNVATVQTTVTVCEAPETYVDEALIKEMADEYLAKIITEDMTLEQKINAIYDYIESHCYYIAQFDKSDYVQAAHLMMTTERGDCFGFYALSRLLFERMGLPNLSVTRLKNEVRTSSHYWNMVSLDNGESWYHFDATPHMTYPTRTCLVTDGDLEAFNELMPNYYYYDHAAFPKTPAA